MPRRGEERRDRRDRRDERQYEDEYNEPVYNEKPPKTFERNQAVDYKVPPKSRVEVHQPTTEVWDYENHWQNDMVECCSSCSMWACAFFCTPCFLGKLFKRTNECLCMCLVPGALMSLRVKLRTGFRIKGSIFHDCIATTCCPLCAAIQMTQELDKQEL